MAAAFALERFDSAPSLAAGAKGAKQADADADSDETTSVLEPDPRSELLPLVSALSSAVKSADSRFETAMAEFTSERAEAWKTGVLAVLPTVAAEAWHRELVQEAATLINFGKIDDAILVVHPAAHEAIVSALTTLAPDVQVTIESSTAILPEQAELNWRFGGAAFDLTSLLDHARAIIRASAPQRRRQE